MIRWMPSWISWVLSLLPKKPEPVTPKKKNMFGIDISHHQGSIDWNQVPIVDKYSEDAPQNLIEKAIDFVIIKATEGQNYVDEKCLINATGAKDRGIRISYYHFATLNTANVIDDAKAEARHFVLKVKRCPAPDLPLVLDIETNKANLPDNLVLQWIKTFFAELEAYGYKKYILYSYTPFLNDVLPANHDLGNIPLWIAAYVNKPQPTLPKGWTKYWAWQYSAKGRVKGLTGDVDLNRTIEPIF